ncbi:hypothetical protein ACNS7O_17965 (plasmid) [Haloferacaceae archaeon DSL9]
MTVRGSYIHAYVLWNAWKHNQVHPAKIDPYKIIWIDPDRIEFVAEPPGLPRFHRLGRIADGDWDRKDTRFADTDVYRAFDAHFNRDREWENTEFFHRILDEIQSGQVRWDCTSRADLEARCQDLDELYESIKEHGFRTQRELANIGIDDPIGRVRYSAYDRLINDEIAVDIGRDGELLFSDGRNRLSIAKVLDVDAIPVLILMRHTYWQQFRDRVSEHVRDAGTLPKMLESHPDLRDLGEDTG